MKISLSKDKVLADVGALVQEGMVTLQDLESVYKFNAPAGAQPVAAPVTDIKQGMKIGNVLYVVGTLIVCLGICLLIGGNWDQMNTVSRIGSTMGLGLLVLAWALYRARQVPDVNKDLLTASLFTIAGVAMTVGVGVIVHESLDTLDAAGTLTGAGLATSGTFALLYLRVVRSAPLLTLAIAAAVFTYFSGVDWIWPGDVSGHSELFYAIETFLAGVAVTGAGVLFRSRPVASLLSDFLYVAGTFMTLGSFFWLTLASGFNDDGSGARSITYDMLYPVFLGFAVWFSVYAQSRSVLVLTALFLTSYIFEISFEYFSEYLGGSVALCLAGVMVMVLAYVTTRFAKRYIATQPRN